MFDAEQRRRISVEELRDLLVGGENFEAETEETGRDCTMEVLRRLMGGGALDPLSGQGGLPMPGLGGLGNFADLIGLAKSASDRINSHDRDDRDDRRDERPRRSRHRGRSADWAGNELSPPDGGSA
jgi:hypothetical protein